MRDRVRQAASARIRRGAERFLELRYGVRTGDYVYHEDLGLETENRVWHDPSNWIALRKALSRLNISEKDVFADIGSGLGRALIVAAGFPFRRVIGVEVSAELNERAEANIRRSRARRRCGAIELATEDALDWEVPSDLTIAYLYCPFTGEVFERVFENLIASVDEHPRALRIVYNYPLEHNLLVRSGRVRVIDVVRSGWPARSSPADAIVTYLALPSDPQLAARYVDQFPRRLDGAEEWLGEYDPGFVLEKPARLGGVVVERPPADRRA